MRRWVWLPLLSVAAAVVAVGGFLGTRGGPPLAPVEAPGPDLAEPDRVRLVVVGDTGKGNAGQQQVAEAMAAVCVRKGCDAVVLLGDNVYPHGLESADDPRGDELIADPYRPIGAPIYGVLGNHDYGRGHQSERGLAQVDWANQRDDVVLPARTYWFESGPAAFFVLDTDEAFWAGHWPQTRWLDEALPGSNARWRVVLGHHPFRSNGRHGNAGTYDSAGLVPIASGGNLRPLFDGPVCEHADLYLSAHEHNSQWIRWCDTDLIVAGGGASPTPVIDRGNDPEFAREGLGFAWLELGPDQGTVAFYDEDGEEQFIGEIRPAAQSGRQ